VSYVTIGRLKPTKIPIIFEGAQGLMLDRDYDVKYGTPTKTGLQNVTELASQLDIDHLDVNYMIRAYMSRHGDGPFPTYDANLSYEDKTNKHNAFQGAPRFGMFDFNQVRDVVQRDIGEHYFSIKPRLVVTHLDQMPPFMEAMVDGEVTVFETKTFAKKMARGLRFDLHGESWGPTRKAVQCHTE
jgi:adenylosuccinate synthase